MAACSAPSDAAVFSRFPLLSELSLRRLVGENSALSADILRAVCAEGLATEDANRSDLLGPLDTEADELDRRGGFKTLLETMESTANCPACQQFLSLIVLWMFPCVARQMGCADLVSSMDLLLSGRMQKRQAGNRSTVNAVSKHPLEIYAALLQACATE
tara:strand:- start:1233 stop:1709 length:477 start_codon:yes stop_codon:yes gene_type:complete